MKVLILDNYDSFVYNIAQYVGETGAEPLVFKNDKIGQKKIKELNPDRIIISPGPGNPCKRSDFGICLQVIRTFSRKIPTLGICLGHQGIGYAFGAKIVGAEKILHGKKSRIVHDSRSVLSGIANPIIAARYHSLVLSKQSIPQCLKVTALSIEDGEIMGIRHKEFPIEGLQFHPESVLTQDGRKIIKNFIDFGVRND